MAVRAQKAILLMTGVPPSPHPLSPLGFVDFEIRNGITDGSEHSEVRVGSQPVSDSFEFLVRNPGLGIRPGGGCFTTLGRTL
jgi:hypothetical protein